MLSENATLPTKGSPHAAGYDLYAAEDVMLPGNGKALIKTDISIIVPFDSYARIAARSSLAWEKHMSVGGGVVDADFRGNILVCLFNHDAQTYFIKKGERVAQLIIERIYSPELEIIDNVTPTERNERGFGFTSTNTFKPSPSSC